MDQGYLCVNIRQLDSMEGEVAITSAVLLDSLVATRARSHSSVIAIDATMCVLPSAPSMLPLVQTLKAPEKV